MIATTLRMADMIFDSNGEGRGPDARRRRRLERRSSYFSVGEFIRAIAYEVLLSCAKALSPQASHNRGH